MNRRQAIAGSAAALSAAALPAMAESAQPTLAVFDPALEISVRFADSWRARGAATASLQDDIVRIVRGLPEGARIAGLTGHAAMTIADGELRARGRRLAWRASPCGSLWAWESP